MTAAVTVGARSSALLQEELAALRRQRQVAEREADQSPGRWGAALEGLRGSEEARRHFLEGASTTGGTIELLRQADQELEHELREAEKREAAALRAERRAEALVLVEQRLAAAGAVDEAIKALAASYERYWRLGEQLEPYADAHGVKASVVLRVEALTDAIIAADGDVARRVLNLKSSVVQPLVDREREVWQRFLVTGTPSAGRNT